MTNRLIVLSALTGTLLATGPVLAMEPYLPRSPRVFAALDGNGDGQITAPELQIRADRRFALADTDRNGEVTTAEIDAALQGVIERRRARLLTLMDKDANGILSHAEFEAYVTELLARADADHDGGVSLDEAQRFRLAKAAK